MIADTIRKSIEGACGTLSLDAREIHLEHPAGLSHGDYSTNVALALAKGRGESPKEIAEQIIGKIEKPKEVEKIEIAGPGFINFFLSKDFFRNSIKEAIEKGETWGSNASFSGKKVMVEYTDPNPFKEFHVGHLMNNSIGESVSRLIACSGAEVKRANYQGDAGLHVAKALWGKMKRPDTAWGDAYAYGAEQYEKNKEAIDEINKEVYEKSDEGVNTLYKSGRTESLEHFEKIYKKLGTQFDFYFFESETGDIGKKIVEKNSTVFEKSDGATIFRGEKYGLHTRVFINSEGLPTYEAKELGLAEKKFDKWQHDISVVVTANEIAEYYKVVMKALEQIEPELSKKIQHITHGVMKLPTGKMSSRTGDVVVAETLIAEVEKVVVQKMKEEHIEDKEKVAEQVAVGALKYSILKQSAGKDIVFDFGKALSFEGDSGPYLQYAAVRAGSVLEKANEDIKATVSDLPETAVALERLLYRFPEVVKRAAEELEPHYVTIYITELAGAFNTLYAQEKIIGGAHAASLLSLTQAFRITMQNGLSLLGIATPSKM